jgi:LPXTG-motif cell wall-anchored protein
MELKKVVLLVAVMAAVVAAAAPAFAQAAVGGSVQYIDCDQIQVALTGQDNVANEQELAGIAQELGVSQNQVSACLSGIAAGEDVNINTATASASAAASRTVATAERGDTRMHQRRIHGRGRIHGRIHGRRVALPETGGASLIVLGAGGLLVAGGLVVRRMAR